jgi:septal ring factor EnvC (AmiA/AmiB activator)
MSQLAVVANGIAVTLQPVSISQLDHILVFWTTIQETVLIVEPLFIVAMMFLSLTIATILIYYRRIRQASKAYEEAKNAVGDIVISFDKQLSRHEEQIGAAVQRLEAQRGRDERLSRQLDAQENRISSVMADVAAKAAKSPDIESVKATLASLEERVEGLSKAQEEWTKRATVVPEAQIEAAIPLRREQALAPLTETELRVLEFIATSQSGERTAPEVKEMIKLTREHTARLMKKLYEGGYLERRSEKTPFAYRVKEEMLKILKKSEVKA